MTESERGKVPAAQINTDIAKITVPARNTNDRVACHTRRAIRQEGASHAGSGDQSAAALLSGFPKLFAGRFRYVEEALCAKPELVLPALIIVCTEAWLSIQRQQVNDRADGSLPLVYEINQLSDGFG